MTPAPIRIDLGRGLRALLFTLVLPMSFIVTADLLLGSLPWLTIAGVVICIPLATVVVNRTVLGELERVVALVAPREVAEDEFAEEFVVEFVEQDGNGEPPAQVLSVSGSGAAADSTPTDWPLDGQPFTEGAQRHHG